MGEEFIEYKGKRKILTSIICFCLVEYAKDYIKENRSAIANISRNVRDAVLIDIINFFPREHYYNNEVCITDLYREKEEKEKVAPNYLLTILREKYKTYLFEYRSLESVLEDVYGNGCLIEFDINDGIKVLFDFMNYIAEVNGYDRKFTMKELYDEYKNKEYKDEMEMLKNFLEKTSKYSLELAKGKNIFDIYIRLLKKYNISNVNKDGNYYLNENVLKQLLILDWKCVGIDEEIYALAYAYAKMCEETKELTNIEILDAKILEMKN